MPFCSNCGSAIEDGVRFCSSCGAQLNPSAAAQPVDKTAGLMRTEDDIRNFIIQTWGEKFYVHESKKMKAHLPYILNALMPDEGIAFLFRGVQNMTATDNSGDHVYAFTNYRMLISYPPNALQSLGRIGGARQGLEVYTYQQITNISYSKGLMLGSINIDFINGSGKITVDKPYVESIYNGINEAFFKYR